SAPLRDGPARRVRSRLRARDPLRDGDGQHPRRDPVPPRAAASGILNDAVSDGRARAGAAPCRAMRALSIAALSLLVSACTAGTQACSDVQCNPAPCCGGSCVTDADCCGGTVCSTDGRCIPEACVACGELGCLVDFAACRATCVAPERCGQACTSDSECGVGAHCFAFAAGDRRCVPNRFEAECARCGADECVFDGARCDVSCRPAA